MNAAAGVRACCLYSQTHGSAQPAHKHQLKMSSWLHADTCVNTPLQTQAPSTSWYHFLFPTLLSVFFKLRHIAGMQGCVARQQYNPLTHTPDIKGCELGPSSVSFGITVSCWNSSLRLSNVWKISQIKGCSVETFLLICPEIGCASKTRLRLLIARPHTDGFSYS